MRLFLALFFEPASLISFKEASAKLYSFSGFRPEPLARLHLTLWFYGTQFSTADSLIHLLKPFSFKRFSVSLNAPLYLPCATEPHVLAYLVKSPALHLMAAKIETLMQTLGLQREREFLPHVTAARLLHAKAFPKLNSLRLNQDLDLQVKEIALIDSVPTASGPLYNIKWQAAAR